MSLYTFFNFISCVVLLIYNLLHFKEKKQILSSASKTAIKRFESKSKKNILSNLEYTGCTVNFRSTILSYKIHKKIDNNPEDWQVIPNTQEAIVDEDTFNRVQELRENRRRNTATGRRSLFSGLAYCADCGSKLYFCASKSIPENAEFFRCSQYKENRGSCTIHFIRNVVLEDLVLQSLRGVAEYVSQFEPVFLYLFQKNHALAKANALKQTKLKVEQSKKRIEEIDKIITALYEDKVLSKITDERFEKFSAIYEKEQNELATFIEKAETEILIAEQEKVDLKIFLNTIRKCTELKKLTPEIVNTLIKRIDVHNPEIIDGEKKVKIDISFTAVGIISIPDEKEILALMNEIREKSA